MTRCAASLLVLLDEVDARNPNRDRASDGGLGDAAHARRKSSHNPNSRGVYRARDFDRDGIDAAGFAEHIRTLGHAGDPRLLDGGYVIFNHRIASERADWAWHAYTGANPHEHHVHVSCTDNPAFYDSRAPWGWLQPAKVLTAAPSWYIEQGPMQLGDHGHGVQVLRNRLHLPTTGPDGDRFTSDVARQIRRLQHAQRWTLNNRCSAREARLLERQATGR